MYKDLLLSEITITLALRLYPPTTVTLTSQELELHELHFLAFSQLVYSVLVEVYL